MALNLVKSTLTMCLLIVLITIFFPQHSHSQAPPPQQQPQPDYSICKKISYNCGKITNISYPFWGQDRPSFCGGGDLFKLTCNNNDKTTAISIGTQNFKVMDINATNSTIKMQRTDRVDHVCSPDFVDTNLSSNLFQFPSTVQNMSIFFNCLFRDPELPYFCGNAFCYAGSLSQLLEENGELKRCRRYIQVPTGRSLKIRNRNEYGFDIVDVDELELGLSEGFRVNYTVIDKCVRCLGREGNCGSDDHGYIDEFVKSSCYYCPDGSIASSNKHCSDKKGTNLAVYEEKCPAPMYNYTLDQTPFTYSSVNSNLSFFYNCTTEPMDYPTYEVDCAKNATHYSFAVFHKEALEHKNYSLNECQFMVNAPLILNATANFTSLLRMNYTDVLKMGFVLNWTAPDCHHCEKSGGRCGFDNYKFVCFCKDKSYLKSCSDGNTFGNIMIILLCATSITSFSVFGIN